MLTPILASLNLKPAPLNHESLNRKVVITMSHLYITGTVTSASRFPESRSQLGPWSLGLTLVDFCFVCRSSGLSDLGLCMDHRMKFRVDLDLAFLFHCFWSTVLALWYQVWGFGFRGKEVEIVIGSLNAKRKPINSRLKSGKFEDS